MRGYSWPPPSRPRRALDRFDDADMRAGAAEIVGERLADIRFAWILGGGQKGRRLHHHAVDAVAALGGLRLDEGLLHRMRVFGTAQPFQRDDLLRVGELRQRR